MYHVKFNKVDINQRNKSGRTALHYACINKNKEMIIKEKSSGFVYAKSKKLSFELL